MASFKAMGTAEYCILWWVAM